MRILIADDNQQVVELLEANLDELEAEIKSAADGEATLKLVQEWKPDLLLLDIMMPRHGAALKSASVCARNAASKNLAILMVTALDQPVDIERAVEAGTDDFLTKPINKTELLLRVRALVKGKNNKNELERVLSYVDAVQHATA